jgi:hypothetical protein
MEPDVLLCSPVAIEECINCEFPNVAVQIDSQREVVSIVFPQYFNLPNGAQITISTEVSQKILVDSIRAIAEKKFSPHEATQALLTCTALSGWDEARSILSD